MIKRLFPPPGTLYKVDYLNADDEEEIEEFCLSHVFGEESDVILAMTHEERLDLLEKNGFEYEL